MNEKSVLDESFTQIPNKVITEIFIKGLLSETEMRIVFYIIRFSWGFHKGWTNKCTVQKIAKDTGMSRRLCSTTINRMIRENKLLKNEGRFKFNEDHQDWKEVLTNPDNKCSQNLTESVNKKEQLVLTNRNSRELNNNGRIATLKNPKESIKERINKEERNIKERKIIFNNEIFKLENIPKEKLEKWKEAFPLIDVDVELKKMEAWLAANPKNKKVNYERFIVNWLSRAKGGKDGRYIPLSRRAIEKGSEGKTCPRNKFGAGSELVSGSYAPGEW